ncbi:3-hydroxyacyl-CoA dehydrogenase family protein [Corticicoccus populi]|uniref:6-phosphogluconate dehydrogenase, decarboxylating n=1 Tax=Corticicoccus populi TaxID=1812821 RepID=A0ABW5X0J0_9STAP
MNVNNITVVGAGAMGSQIALSFALHGFKVILNDITDEKLNLVEENLKKLMRRRVEKGRISEAECQEAFNNLKFSSSLEQSVKDTDLVVEAVIEDLKIKRELFVQLDELAPAHAVLASNSSTIVSSKIAEATNRPDKICNMHFFNPAVIMDLVEIVKGPHTADETIETITEVTRQINKTPVVLEKEIFGFIVSRIVNVIFDEAMYLYEEGIASIEDIDTAVEKGLNHPIGPFKLLDLTGIDVNYYLRKERVDETGDETYAPQKSLTQLFEEGHLGRKTGKGFYDYN